jgi:hypothetical protein
VIPAFHASTPYEIGQDRETDGPEQDEAQHHGRRSRPVCRCRQASPRYPSNAPCQCK